MTTPPLHTFGAPTAHVGLGKTNATIQMLTQFRSKKSSTPGLNTQRARPGIVFVSTREEVEASDVRRLVALASPKQPVSALKSIRGRIIFTVSGYDDVGDELFEIESVRRFYAHAQAVWPSWLFTAHLSSPSFCAVVLSLLPHLTIIRGKADNHWQAQVCQCEVEQFFEASLRPAAILHHLTGISRKTGLRHLKSAASYLNVQSA